MAAASEVLDLARDGMLGFDDAFLEDAVLLRRLTQRQKVLIDRLIRLDRMGEALPGDANANVSVAVYAASYVIPAAAWRVRQTRVNYSSGTSQQAFIVPANWRHNVPEETPAMYFQGANFFPLDGATSVGTRIYGWLDAANVEFDYVTEPADLSADTDTIAAPDEAIPFLAADLKVLMGTRGKVAVTTLNEFKGDRDAEERKLFQLWEGGRSA